MRNILIALTLILVACGPDNSHIKLDGHLLNLNQGEFLVYSTDGAIQGIDTITVMGGRFEYEPLCEHEGTIVITMPNGQEVPVFVKPGKAYSVSGDAQNLKMVKVEGGDENKLMNEFREQVAQSSADTVPAEAIAKLVENNPTSAVGLYLVTRHIIQRKGDYAAARRLLDKMLAADSENTRVRVLQNQATEMELVMKGKRIPAFSATDVNGKTVSEQDLMTGTTIIASYAVWDFESTNQVRRIRGIDAEKQKKWRTIAISFDPYRKTAKDALAMYADDIYIICDEKMSETPLAHKFGMLQTGMVTIVKDGVIVERSLYGEPLYSYLRSL